MGEVVASVQQSGAVARALTEQQARLVELLTSATSDHDITSIWEVAGYANLASARQALGSVAVQAALLASRRATIGGPMAQAALAAISELITDRKTPSATRLAAAKWTLEQAGHQREAGDGQDKPIHEMTASELEAFMARAQAVVDAGGDPPVIAVVPDNGA